MSKLARQLEATNSSVPTATAESPPLSLGADGYWLSSLELRCGLDMHVLAVSRVPGDVLRELLRLHGFWLERGAINMSSLSSVDIPIAIGEPEGAAVPALSH